MNGRILLIGLLAIVLFGCGDRESMVYKQSKSYIENRIDLQLNKEESDIYKVRNLSIDSIFPISSEQLYRGMLIRKESLVCVKQDSLNSFGVYGKPSTSDSTLLKKEIKQLEQCILKMKEEIAVKSDTDTIGYAVLLSYALFNNISDELIEQPTSRVHVYNRDYLLNRQWTMSFQYIDVGFECNERLNSAYGRK